MDGRCSSVRGERVCLVQYVAQEKGKECNIEYRAEASVLEGVHTSSCGSDGGKGEGDEASQRSYRCSPQRE